MGWAGCGRESAPNRRWLRSPRGFGRPRSSHRKMGVEFVPPGACKVHPIFRCRPPKGLSAPNSASSFAASWLLRRSVLTSRRPVGAESSAESRRQLAVAPFRPNQPEGPSAPYPAPSFAASWLLRRSVLISRRARRRHIQRRVSPPASAGRRAPRGGRSGPDSAARWSRGLPGPIRELPMRPSRPRLVGCRVAPHSAQCNPRCARFRIRVNESLC